MKCRMRFIIPLIVLFAAPAFAIEKCGSGQRITCVVDGDTFWLDGVKIRMEGYDTPEPQTGICGIREAYYTYLPNRLLQSSGG